MSQLNLERSHALSLAVAGTALVFVAWGCLVVLKPFIPAIMLAMILALATWPAYMWLAAKFKGRQTLASLCMTLLVALCFLAPLLFVGSSLAENMGKVTALVTGVLKNDQEKLLSFLGSVPVAGTHLVNIWNENFSNIEKFTAALGDKAAPVSQAVLKVGAAIGSGVIDISLGIVIAFFFFRHGTQVSTRLGNLSERFMGPRAKHLLLVSKNTLVSVVYGVLGTALVQGALTGVGLWIAGVPGAPFLGLVTFFLAFLPIGPPLIWIPASIWLFATGNQEMSIFMAGWGFFVVSGIDNVIRPYFISLGTDLPLLLVLMGVFGGIIAFGFIGLFIGPTLLAVSYTLIKEWSIKNNA